MRTPHPLCSTTHVINSFHSTGLSDTTRSYNLFPADEPSRLLDDDSLTLEDAKLDKRVVVFQWV